MLKFYGEKQASCDFVKAFELDRQNPFVLSLHLDHSLAYRASKLLYLLRYAQIAAHPLQISLAQCQRWGRESLIVHKGAPYCLIQISRSVSEPFRLRSHI